MSKAVIYARYSSTNQREESIEGQIRECTDFAKRQDITIVGSYIDRALTGKTDARPQFQKMISDSGKQLFDIVIVYTLDRFARNRYDSATYKAKLKKKRRQSHFCQREYHRRSIRHNPRICVRRYGRILQCRISTKGFTWYD